MITFQKVSNILSFLFFLHEKAETAVKLKKFWIQRATQFGYERISWYSWYFIGNFQLSQALFSCILSSKRAWWCQENIHSPKQHWNWIPLLLGGKITVKSRNRSVAWIPLLVCISWVFIGYRSISMYLMSMPKLLKVMWEYNTYCEYIWSCFILL